MRYCNLAKVEGWKNLPESLYVCDSNVAIDAALGHSECVRIIESQDRTNLNFGFPYGVKDEVNFVLKRDYGKVGSEWFNKILNERDFTIIDLRNYTPMIGGIRGVLDRGELDKVDRYLIKSLFIDKVIGIVSRDFRDIINNPRLKWLLRYKKRYRWKEICSPEKFCEVHDDELIPYGLRNKLSTKFRVLKDKLEYRILRI